MVPNQTVVSSLNLAPVWCFLYHQTTLQFIQLLKAESRTPSLLLYHQFLPHVHSDSFLVYIFISRSNINTLVQAILPEHLS